jgi:hypothetical protein
MVLAATNLGLHRGLDHEHAAMLTNLVTGMVRDSIELRSGASSSRRVYRRSSFCGWSGCQYFPFCAAIRLDPLTL